MLEVSEGHMNSSKTLHPQRVSVYCALWSGWVFATYFFKNAVSNW